MRTILLAGVLACFSVASTVQAQVQWGRDVEYRKTFGIQLLLGSVFDLEGEIQETTRPIEVIGGPTSGAPPEDYSWKDLGFDQEFMTGGFALEKLWPFVTLQAQFARGNPKVSSVADRNYYIGVGSVRFQGRDYDYLVIPEGEAFSGEIDLYTIDLRMLITPVSFGSADSVSFTPWLHLGIYTFIADYELDAGTARAITLYENPPREYVIGGRATGTTGLAIPELGIGGELRLKPTERVAFTLQAYAAFLQYNGKNSDFGLSSRNEKAVEVDYTSVGIKAALEMALTPRVDFIGGAEYKRWEGDAEIRATDKDEETILAIREKFDKDASFGMASLIFFLGLRF